LKLFEQRRDLGVRVCRREKRQLWGVVEPSATAKRASAPAAPGRFLHWSFSSNATTFALVPATAKSGS